MANLFGQNIDPEQRRGLLTNLALQTGLGMMQAGAQGAPLGGAVAQGALPALGNMQQLVQQSYMNTLQKRQQEREDELFRMTQEAAERAQDRQSKLDQTLYGRESRPAFKPGMDPQATQGLLGRMEAGYQPTTTDLARIAGLGGSEALLGALTPSQLSASDLVEVAGPDGPRYLPASAAIGQAPYQEPDTLSASDLVEVMTPNGPVYRPAAAAVGQPVPGDDPSMSAVNVLLPNDGGRVRGRRNDQGDLEIINENGEWVRAPRGAQMIGLNLSGSEEDLGITDPELRSFRELTAAVPYVQRLQERIAEGLQSGAYVGGISGDTLRTLNSLRNQATQIYQNFNTNVPEGQRDVELSVDKFRPQLGEIAEAGSQVASAVLDLAYLTLKAKDPGGRVSDNDIRLELNTFGLNTSDPQIIMERVNDKIGDLMTTYEATANVLQQPMQYKPVQPQQLGPGLGQTPQPGGIGNQPEAGAIPWDQLEP